MAPNNNQVVKAALQYIDSHLREHTDYESRRAALSPVAARGQFPYNKQGSRGPHDGASMLEALERATDKPKCKPEHYSLSRGEKVDLVFAKGSKLFTDEYLEKIGYSRPAPSGSRVDSNAPVETEENFSEAEDTAPQQDSRGKKRSRGHDDSDEQSEATPEPPAKKRRSNTHSPQQEEFKYPNQHTPQHSLSPGAVNPTSNSEHGGVNDDHEKEQSEDPIEQAFRDFHTPSAEDSIRNSEDEEFEDPRQGACRHARTPAAESSAGHNENGDDMYRYDNEEPGSPHSRQSEAEPTEEIAVDTILDIRDLTEAISLLNGKILDAVDAVFANNAGQDHVRLNPEAPKRLKATYKSVLGKDWQKIDPVLSFSELVGADTFLQALIWHLLRTLILEADPPWKTASQLYSDDVILRHFIEPIIHQNTDEDGSSFEDMCRQATLDQFRDEDFSRRNLWPGASIITNRILMALREHLGELHPNDLNPRWESPLIDSLRFICKEAYILQARMQGSVSKCRLLWYDQDHLPPLESPEDWTSNSFVFTVAPGMAKQRTNGSWKCVLEADVVFGELPDDDYPVGNE